MTKRVLGRGLDALIPETASEISPPAAAAPEIPLDLIRPNPEQPRREMSPESLDELARSIARYGIIEPIVVRRRDDGYELVAGERRVMAARRAGLTVIPAIERESTSEEMLAVALIENVQREDLNPIEEAHAYRRLQDEYGLPQEAIAERVGRSRVYIANTVRLLQLPEDIRLDVSRGAISAGHARAILAAEGDDARRALWRRILDDGLTVRAAEATVQESKPGGRRAKKPRNPGTPISPEARDLEERLREQLGTEVRIVQRGRGGRLELSFFDMTDLQRLLELIGLPDAL